MANPPYSGSIIFLVENQDGIEAVVYHWDEVASGTPIPPAPRGFINDVFNAIPQPSFHTNRQCVSRADLKTKFGQFVDAKFPDTQAT